VTEQRPARPTLAVPGEARFGHTEMVMGTAVTFDVRLDSERDGTRAAAARAVQDAVAWLQWVDRTFTTYDPGSFVCRLGRGEIAVEDCPPQVAEIVAACEGFRDATQGWFDPWAGPGGGFDPSGLVKGWAAQAASGLIAARGFERHCVNAGGDVAVRGRPAGRRGWGVGVAHPLVSGTLCAAVEVCDEAVATSGCAERGYHVWRPRDRSRAMDLASVTIVHRDLATADVYATAAFAMGLEARAWLVAHEVDAYLVDAQGHEWLTPGFQRRRTWPRAAGGP
jgi:thiamine biosynthesis lipoprotein